MSLSKYLLEKDYEVLLEKLQKIISNISYEIDKLYYFMLYNSLYYFIHYF